MNHSSTILISTLLIAVCLPLALCASTSFEDYKAIYDKQVESIDSECNGASGEALTAYMQNVEAIKLRYQRAGDLDGTQAAVKEIARLKGERSVPKASLPSTHVSIEAARKLYRESVQNADDRKHKAVVTLSGHYTRKLKTLVKEFVQQNKLDQAIKVNAEIKRIELMLAAAATDVPVKKATPPTVPVVSKTPSWKTGLPSALEKGLVLYYDFDKNESDQVTDKSGKANHGKLNGAKWTSKGKVGGACEFDGENDWIDCGNDSSFNIRGPLSISLWVNFKELDNRSICKKGLGAGGESWLVDVLKRGGRARLRLLRRTPHRAFLQVMSDKWLEAGRWYHVVAVSDGSNLRIYQDTEEAVSQKPYQGDFAINDQVVSLGGSQSRAGVAAGIYDFCINGRLDEVMIFDRALSEAEVKQLYKNGR